MDEQQEIIQEFLVESNDNLTQLDQDFVALEQQPDDRALLSSIFRTVHTIKGACGFLGFEKLEAITHRAENLLSRLRDGELRLTPELTTLLLEAIDVVKAVLAEIESSGEEGGEDYQELRDRLQSAAEGEPVDAAVDAAIAATGDIAQQGRPAPAAAPDEPPAAAEDGPEPSAARSVLADSNIRVSVDLLDSLMNLVGELVLARNQILQYAETRRDAGFTATSQRLDLITTELQANVMKTRMQPIRVVWNKLPRVVRDLGLSFGKQIDLVMEGADTELDKAIIEAIKDPLMHIVRNSCDHGLETPERREAAGKPARGRLLLRSYHEGGHVNIEIADDGAGIDAVKLKQKAQQEGLIASDQAERMTEREALDLIFLPGLSTAAQATRVSGRGVGMDVVRANIEKIGGSIDLQSRVGRGATIKIKIPLTLAIIPALVVECGGERFAIPQVNLVELVRVEREHGQQIERIHGAPLYRLRGKLLPLVDLYEALGLGKSAERARDDESINIIVVQANDKSFGLIVDGVLDTAEIVVKPLGKLLEGLTCYAGATIMGDGRVALILDVTGLAQLGRVRSENGVQLRTPAAAEAERRQAVLLFRSGERERLAAPLELVDRLEQFPVERIETSGERHVVQYRDQILPLAFLAETLGFGRPRPSDPAKVQAVVFSEGSKRIGLVVDEILDIVEEEVRVRARSTRPGVLGSAIVAGQVTEFIDLHDLIERVDKDWFGGTVEGPAGARVLLVEGSAFTRRLMRGDLEMAGCRVVEAGGAGEALERLSAEPVDVVVSSLDLPGEGSFELIEQLRSRPELGRVRAVGLSGTADEPARYRERPAQYDEYQSKFDRASMLASIERLARAVRETGLAPAVPGSNKPVNGEEPVTA